MSRKWRNILIGVVAVAAVVALVILLSRDTGDNSSKYAGTTLIVIAQRISSIMNLDEIIVLNEGGMIGKGTHEELMRNCPVYREIQQTQMGEAE